MVCNKSLQTVFLTVSAKIDTNKFFQTISSKCWYKFNEIHFLPPYMQELIYLTEFCLASVIIIVVQPAIVVHNPEKEAVYPFWEAKSCQKNKNKCKNGKR